MHLNIQINGIKASYRAKSCNYFGEEVQDYKDGSGLQFKKFDFVTVRQDIKIAILVTGS